MKPRCEYPEGDWLRANDVFGTCFHYPGRGHTALQRIRSRSFRPATSCSVLCRPPGGSDTSSFAGCPDGPHFRFRRLMKPRVTSIDIFTSFISGVRREAWRLITSLPSLVMPTLVDDWPEAVGGPASLCIRTVYPYCVGTDSENADRTSRGGARGRVELKASIMKSLTTPPLERAIMVILCMSGAISWSFGGCRREIITDTNIPKNIRDSAALCAFPSPLPLAGAGAGEKAGMSPAINLYDTLLPPCSNRQSVSCASPAFLSP